jgi:hypothetical protein
LTTYSVFFADFFPLHSGSAAFSYSEICHGTIFLTNPGVPNASDFILCHCTLEMFGFWMIWLEFGSQVYSDVQKKVAQS